MTTRIYVEESKPGKFTAYLDRPFEVQNTPHLLVAFRRQPLLDSARVLQRKGMAGKLEMWDAVRPYPRMIGDIETLAGLTIQETDRRGLEVRSWKAYPAPPVAPPTAGKGLEGG